MIVVHCECGKTLQVPGNTPAAKGICPNCRRVLLLPREGEPPKLRATLTGHRGAIRDVALSPNGRLLASVSANDEPTSGKPKPGEARLWDIASGQPLANLQGHSGAVFAAAFAPHDESLVTSGKDHMLAVWNVTRGLHGVVAGVKEHTLTGHQHSVSSLAFSRDGRTLASAASDEIVLWDTTTWRQRGTLQVDRQGVCRLAFSPGGSLLAGVWSSRGAVVLWDAQTRTEAVRLLLPSDEITSDHALAFSPNGSQLAVVSDDGIRIWDVSTCQVLLVIESAGLRAVTFAHDGLTLLAGGNDLPDHIYLRRWDASSGRRLQEFPGHKRPLTCLALSTNGRLLASGSEDKTVNLWELPAGVPAGA